jgi:nitronate monooxygenase
MGFLERIGLDLPVVQAGMGGGVAGAELAGAVSAAGGLGTVGIMAPSAFAAALAGARRRAPGRPVAANLLVPFVRRQHVDACIASQAALVVFHGGLPGRRATALHEAGIPVLVTVGGPAEARRALADGADGLVVQGVEAGGHLMGAQPLAAVLPRVLEDVGEGVPVFAAGGVADSSDVLRLIAAGATAAVAGTRFLLTEESGANEEYKRRVLDADRTLVTLLFGLGWPLRHRVVPNAATDRWCADTDLGAGWVRAMGRLSAPLGRALPLGAQGRVSALQRVGVPLFSPALPVVGTPPDRADRLALYAGETVHRIDGIVTAAEAVARLAP